MARLEDNTWHFWWELAYCSDAGGQPGHALMWQASTLRQAWGGKLPEFRWLPALQLIMAGFGMEAFHVLHHGRGERRAAIGRISTLALLLCSVVLIQRPQTTQTTRVKIVALLRRMVDTVASLDISAEFHIPVGGAVVTLRLLRSGELDGLHGVLQHMPAIQALWQAHAGRGPFRGECGGAFRLSVPSAALCIDFLVLLALLYRDQTQWWADVGQPLLIRLVRGLAAGFEARMWQQQAVRHAESTPSAIRPRGRARQQLVDSPVIVNAVRDLLGGGDQNNIEDHLLQKVRRSILHLYMQNARAAFAGRASGVSCSWDPGVHSGSDWLVLVCLAQSGVLSYGPPIRMQPVPDDLQQPHVSVLEALRKGHELQRKAAYDELAALDLCLQSGLGISVRDFAPPRADFVRPLQRGEVRKALGPGLGFAIVVEESGEVLGAEMHMQIPKWCTHWADQGSIGAAGINFLTNHLGYYMCLFADPNHRVWNDLKQSFKKSQGYFWRSLLFMTHVFNLNYGPFGKGVFFEKKKDFYEEWVQRAGPADALFRKYAARIADAQGVAEPVSDSDYAELFSKCTRMANAVHKGPLVKLMRWAGGQYLFVRLFRCAVLAAIGRLIRVRAWRSRVRACIVLCHATVVD